MPLLAELTSDEIARGFVEEGVKVINGQTIQVLYDQSDVDNGYRTYTERRSVATAP